MLKIALVNEMHNLRQGGVYRSTEALKSTLEKLGAKTEILAIKKRGGWWNTLVNIPYLREFLIWPLWNRHLINQLDREGFDVALYRGTTSLFLAKKGRVKKVIYTRGLLERQLDILKQLDIPVYIKLAATFLLPFIYGAEYVSLRRADRIIASKQLFAEHILKRFRVKPTKIVILPQMIDISFPKIKAAKKYDLLFVGRLSVPKNWPLVTELAAMNKYRIAVAVPEPLEPAPIAANITFFFKLPYEQMPALFASAKVFIMPSFVESGPRVTLEAMAGGLPVVASPDGAGGFIREGVNGYIVKENRLDSYARAIDRLLADPALAEQMGETNRHESKKYSPSKLGPQYLEALTF